jgi:tripartite-type tricarboxylate transporter receptor subunit TctC
VTARLTSLGFDIQTRSQPDFDAYVKSEVGKWQRVIQKTGINPN